MGHPNRWNILATLLAYLTLLWAPVFADATEIPITASEIHRVNLISNDIIYDPVSRRIFASVPGSAGPGGNSVVSIDPNTGEVGEPILVGSEPGAMTVSDDGKYLYVALGTGEVRRVDLPARKAGPHFNVGGVRHFDVLPGQHDVLVVSRGGAAGMGAGVALFENGVMRPKTGGPNTYALSFGPRLYTYQNEISSWDFNTYSVDAVGLIHRAGTGSLLIGNLGIRGDRNGRVYTNNGQVVDPETHRLIARLPGPGFGYMPLPDPSVGRIFFLNDSRNDTHITSFDYRTFVALDSLHVPGIRAVGSLIRWGADGFAFRTEKQVVYFRSRIAGKTVPSADLGVTVAHSPPFVTVGRSITCTITVTNNGPGPATGISLSYHVPEGIEVVSSRITDGQITASARMIAVDIGDLAVKAKVTLTILLTPVGAKKWITTAVVRGDQADSHPENNTVDHPIDNLPK